MVDDKNNHQNPEEEEQSEFGKKESTFTERDDVDAEEEDHGAEARDEGPEDAYSVQSPVPEESLHEHPNLSTAEISAMRDVSPQVAASFAEAAESRRAEAELRTRELQLKAQQAEWEAARQADLQDAQVQLELESRKQEAEARKAEAAQIRERNKQEFELQKNKWSNKWSIDKMRGIVSLLLVVGFLATTVIAIFLNATGRAEADMLQTVASLYSGITGAVLGFYFGRQQQ